jgi:hypothetical protein
LKIISAALGVSRRYLYGISSKVTLLQQLLPRICPRHRTAEQCLVRGGQRGRATQTRTPALQELGSALVIFVRQTSKNVSRGSSARITGPVAPASKSALDEHTII